ncbi:hypothetical protein [Brasilonema bromeliae]
MVNQEDLRRLDLRVNELLLNDDNDFLSIVQYFASASNANVTQD